MKTMRRFCLECGRLLRSRETWAVLLLTLASPLAGLWLYAPATGTTMLSVYLANPALAGGVIGGLLFALLTVVEMDRAHRCRADVLLDAVASPLELARVRLAALLAGQARRDTEYAMRGAESRGSREPLRCGGGQTFTPRERVRPRLWGAGRHRPA